MRSLTWPVVRLIGLTAAMWACGDNDPGDDDAGTGGTGGHGGIDTGGTGGDEPSGGSGGDDETGGTGGSSPTGGTGGGGKGGGGIGGTGGEDPSVCPVIPPIDFAHIVERWTNWVRALGYFASPGLSGTNRDVMYFDFETLDTGHFEFGPGTSNVGPDQCDQCFRLFLKINPDFDGTKEFFPESGSVDLTATTETVDGVTSWKTLTVKHNDVVFRRYAYSTRIPTGACYTMQQEIVFE